MDARSTNFIAGGRLAVARPDLRAGLVTQPRPQRDAMTWGIRLIVAMTGLVLLTAGTLGWLVRGGIERPVVAAGLVMLAGIRARRTPIPIDWPRS